MLERELANIILENLTVENTMDWTTLANVLTSISSYRNFSKVGIEKVGVFEG